MTTMELRFNQIVPASGFELDKEVVRDCAVATSLLHKIMSETPSLTPMEAFENLKSMLSKICIFHWDRMKLVRS